MKIENKEDWTCQKPILFLPNQIKNLFKSEASYLLQDLKENNLKVVLVPAPNPNFDSHKIRKCYQKNPE